MKESPNYRDALARLDELFPHKEWLSVGDVVKLSGHSYIWVNKYLGIHKPGISKVALAKLM